MDELSPEKRSEICIEGLSLGDGFGETFFRAPGLARRAPDERELPPGPWRYTDDTVMALGIHEVLRERGEVDADRLADIFARRYGAEPWRGYGPGARRILEAIEEGAHWREISEAAFDGEGSFGNGGAMRVAPVGAYFADDLDAVVGAAQSSAWITHAHPEGRAGAIAVAVASAAAWRTRQYSSEEAADLLVEFVLRRTPDGEVREGIERAKELGVDRSVREAADVLGCGKRVTAMDTVPFVIWSAMRHLDDTLEVLWRTVAGLGDRDTTCAMVGGIVSQRTLLEDVPDEWFDRREELDW